MSQTKLPETFINLPLRLERERLAQSHLAQARKRALIGITQTKLGLLHLYYDAQTKTYRLVQCGENPMTIAQGKKAIVKASLVNAYQGEMVEENEEEQDH